MWTLPCRIVSPVPDDPTQSVEAEWVDADERAWRFRDKLVIFREDREDREDREGGDAAGVRDGIRCTLLRIGRHQGQLAYWVSTTRPDGLASIPEQRAEFIAREAQFCAQPQDYAAQFETIERNHGFIDIDFLQHAIALGLGVLPPGTGFNDAKPMYWSAGDSVGDFTLGVIRVLLDQRALAEAPDDATLLRWTAHAPDAPRGPTRE